MSTTPRATSPTAELSSGAPATPTASGGRSWARIGGIPLLIFAIIFVGVMGAAIAEVIPETFMGGLALALVLGMGLNWIGEQIPVLKDLGFGTILAVLVPAILIEISVLPTTTRDFQDAFFGDLTSFAVPGLLVGSVLAMPKSVLVQAGIRFIIPLLGTLTLTTLATGAVGAVLGYGFVETMLYIAGPILGAGISASAVPLSEIYAGQSGGSPDDYITTMASSVMIANILTILVAAVLGGMARKNPDKPFKGFAGRDGALLRKQSDTPTGLSDDNNIAAKVGDLLTGLLIVAGIVIFGEIGQTLVPSMHAYLWMILICLVLKLGGLLPERLASSTGAWSGFLAKVMVPAILASISMGVINIGELLGLVSDPTYLALCVITVLFALVISGALTYLFGFFMVEGTIMTGIGLADMGGTGDVAVLTAAKKMYLLPFLTISSRIGGAANMLWLTGLAIAFLG
jgi:Na+/citrate or Na+/malate symporter